MPTDSSLPLLRRGGNLGITQDVPSPTPTEIARELDALFDQMILHQRAKVLRLAQQVDPRIGPDDVLNPHDFPGLKAHPTFEYEDGQLAGLIAAQAAVRAELRQHQPD